MRIPTWRLALTGGAIVVLLVVGIGFVAASTSAPASQTTAGLPAATAAPGASANPNKIGQRLKALLGREGRLSVGRRVVHAVGTFQLKDGTLVTIQIDHGTIQSIGSGHLTIAEAGGSTVTVSTDASTVVWIGRTKGTLSDLKVGDTIYVQSRIDGGTTLAKRVLKVPTATSS
jgi:Domain of unknown function (DUF5666)